MTIMAIQEVKDFLKRQTDFDFTIIKNYDSLPSVTFLFFDVIKEKDRKELIGLIADIGYRFFPNVVCVNIAFVKDITVVNRELHITAIEINSPYDPYHCNNNF